GQSVLSWGADGLVVLQNLAGRKVWTLLQSASGLGNLHFSPDGKRLLLRTASRLAVADAVSGRLLREWPVQDSFTHRYLTAAFAPDGRRATAVTVTRDRKQMAVLLFDPASGKEEILHRWPALNPLLTDARLSGDGKLLAV